MSDTEMTQDGSKERDRWKVRCTECNRVGRWMLTDLTRDAASAWMVRHSMSQHGGAQRVVEAP